MATSGDQFDPTSLARELNTSLSLADSSPVKPDDEAKLREVSKRLGIPLDSARTDPQAAIKAGQQDAFDPVKFAERFPSTAKHLANVDNALISNDDRDPLASVETAVRQVGTSTANLGRSVGAAPFDVSSALYGLLESTFALGSQMVGRPLAENRILPEDVFARGRQFFEQQRKAGAKIADNIAPAGGSMGFVETAVNQGIRSFAQQAPGLAASVLTGNPAFALGMAGVQSGSTSTTKALDKGLTPVQALAYGATDAVIEIGTEKIPVSAFINDMKVGSGFFKTLIKNQLTEQPSEQVATALQDFNAWATLRPDATIADYISERPEAAAQTAIATLAGGVAQTSVFKGVQAVAERANGRQQEADTATAVAQQLDEVMAAAATSQTRVRDPQTFAQMVQDAAESSGTAPTELFIDAQPLLAIIEQAGITPEQLTQMLPSVAEQIEEAIATDGTLTIPVGEATAAFAGSGFEQELVRNARTSVNGISLADAEQAGATVEALGAEAQQIIAEQQDKDAWEMSAKVVFDKVAAQLNTAGRFTPEVNRAYATVARDYYAVQAAKMGITPEQLYAQFPITTDARLPGGSDVLRRAGVLDQFAGQGASTADLNALTRAQQMSTKGVSNDAVLRETGWFKGVDGRWRFEISDDKAAFKQTVVDMDAAYAEAETATVVPDGSLFKAKYKVDTPDYIATFGRTEEDAIDNLAKALAKRTTGSPFSIANIKDGDTLVLSDVLEHPDLFAAYPFLRNMAVTFQKGGDINERGAFYENRNTIEVNADRKPDEVLSTLLHEIQHAIQAREDFARGGNMDSRFTDSVRAALRNMSESEARAVEQWKDDNPDLLAKVDKAAEVARNALKYESAERLLAYSERDKPSGVFRLIRNELQWIYDQDFRGNEAARNLQYAFYGMPKRGDKRNAHIRDMAFKASQVIRDSIPADQLALFKSDTRTMKGMIAALQRETGRARKALQPLREKQQRAAVAEGVLESTKLKGPYEVYRALAGEIEARTTQARQGMTTEERRQRPARLDMDVAPSEAIVIVGGRELLIPFSTMDQGDKLNQPAYHGSPYRFDKFTLDAIGSGEGAQAYGWGLYFAGKREVSEAYRTQLSANRDVVSTEWRMNGEPIDTAGEMWRKDSGILQDIQAKGYDRALADYEKRLADRKAKLPDGHVLIGAAEKVVERVKQYEGAVVEHAVDVKEWGPGQLYRVEIPEDDQYLLWDSPMSEQTPKVREALKGLGIGSEKDPDTMSDDELLGALGTFEQTLSGAEKSGEGFYKELSDYFGTDKAASLALRDLGIAGIKYLDGMSRGGEGDSFNYVVFDDQAVQIAETFYQQESAPRATFDPASLNIALLEKADLSSYLHELGHAFFEISAHLAARPDAPQAIRDDIRTLFDTTGYTGTVQEWLATPVGQRRIAHETIAESFEQYLLEGKAPTLEQQALFAKLRSWMVSVYRTLADFLSRNGNANLTAEVRSVFDRMLANDEAIAATKAARGATPLFTSAEQAGMTPEQFAEYQAATGEIDEDAVRELDSRSLRDLKWLRTARSRKIKELQADATAKRRNARIEARRQLLNEPVYRALTFLRGKVEPVPVEKRSGKKLDARRDDIETAIAKLGGMNREEVMRQFGVDRVSFPTKIVGFPTLRAGGAGKSIDAMGEALAEIGYLRYDENGKYDLAELEEKLLDQDRGISHYSMEADWDLINGYKMLPAPEDADTLAISAGRLSLPELEERLGNTDIDFAKLGIGRRGMIQQMGMPMDVIAELTGFRSGEDMVRALVDVEPLQAATEGLTDRIMLERYGDLSSPEAIERAADQALASEARTRMVATELSRLNTSVGSARVVATVAKQTAQQVVARQKIRNVRPDKTAGAQARAGKGAEAAFRKGDIETAAGFKRSQVLNAAIEREQRQTRVEIDKARDNFSAMFGNDKRAGKTRDMNLVNAARAMVARYGLAPTVAGQRAEDYQALLREYNPAMADNIQALFETLPDPKDYRELTVEEFRGMRDAVLGIYQMSRRVMQTRIDGKLVEQDEVATVLVEAVLKRNGGELPGLLGYDSTITDAQKRKVGLLGLKAVGTRVEQWSDAMGAEVKRAIYQQVSDAAVQARLKRTELIAAYKQLLDGVKGGITYDKIVAPELGGFEFTRGKTELLHAILHTGNESNKRKLLLGRRWAELDAEGNLDTVRWDSFVDRMVKQGVLTESDFDFAQGVWDLLETVKADAQKAHFDIFGYYFNEVTANTFIDPFGVERRGGYVPALVTALSAADQAQKREAEAAQQGGNSYMFPTTGKGFTNARVEYNRPLELDLRTIGSHLDKVARFAFLEPAINDTGRLLQNKRVARALNGLDTNIISKMLTPWLQRAATQTTTVPTRFPQADKFFRGLRTRSGMYIMFANVINTLQQLTGFSVAAVKVPAPKMLRALKAYTGNPGELARMTAELSAFMRDRLDNQGFEMTLQIEEILTNPTVLDKAGDFMKRNTYFLQTGLQNVMDVVVWQAAYDHARSMTGVSDKQAIRYADETIRTTQGTFAPEAVSGIEVQPAFIQLFTQFWGYFNMLANTLGGEAGKAVREMGYMASTPRLLFIWFAGLAIPAVVGQMIAQGIPDDEDDEDGDGTLDEWLAMFFGSQASTLAAMVPGVGQLSMLVANQFDSKVYNDRLNLSPAISMIDSAAGGAKAVLQGTAFDDRLTKKEVRDVAIAIALATGAPTNVVAKPLGYVIDVEEGKKDPDNAAEYGIGLLTGR